MFGRWMVLVSVLLAITALVAIVFLFKLLADWCVPSLNLERAHCIVTGGSQGIGKELAKELANRGAHVTIVARRQSLLDEARDEISAARSRSDTDVNTIAIDLSESETAVKDAFNPLCEKYGGCDVLICNAGTSFVGQFLETPSSEFTRMFDVNVKSAVHSTAAALPHMLTRNRGRIVIVASQAAQVGLFGYTAYCSSKWALRGLAEALQMEVFYNNILVSVAFPPNTDTPGFEVENKGKPAVVRALEDTSGLFTAKDVARTIVRDTLRGAFYISMGIEGWLLSILTSGFSPATNIFEFAQQVCFASLARFVSVIFRCEMYEKVRKATSSSNTKIKAD